MLKPKARAETATAIANSLEHATKSFTASGRIAVQSVKEQQILDAHWNEFQSALVAKIFQKKPYLRKMDMELSYHDRILEFRFGSIEV